MGLSQSWLFQLAKNSKMRFLHINKYNWCFNSSISSPPYIISIYNNSSNNNNSLQFWAEWMFQDAKHSLQVNIWLPFQTNWTIISIYFHNFNVHNNYMNVQYIRCHSILLKNVCLCWKCQLINKLLKLLLSCLICYHNFFFFTTSNKIRWTVNVSHL